MSVQTNECTENQEIKVVIVEDYKLTRVGLRCALNQIENINVLAEAESAQETESGTEIVSEEESEAGAESSDDENASSQENAGASSGASSVPNSGKFTVSETVNIRKGVSETSEKIAVCYPGETLEILMKQADGWTRVRYQGQTGYVRSDVLK